MQRGARRPRDERFVCQSPDDALAQYGWVEAIGNGLDANF